MPRRSTPTDAHRASAPRGAHPLGAALALGVASVALIAQVPQPRARHGCPPGTLMIEQRYCVDRFEGSLLEVGERGGARPWDPCRPPERDRHYRAVSRAGVLPQGYVSQRAAAAACAASGKRLCTEPEWVGACRGPEPTTYPYGDAHIAGRCNDDGVNPVPRIFAGERDVFHFEQMNDPRLDRLPRTVARTGEFRRCTNRYGVRDMVGNLHEWVDAHYGSLGVFRGGYFADAHQNGDGCNYATRAHSPGYHDYSTGFRCCADPR